MQGKTVNKTVFIIGDAVELAPLQKHKAIRQVAKGLRWKPCWRLVEAVTLARVVLHLLDLPSGWPLPDMLIIHLGSSCDIPLGNLEERVQSIREHLVMIQQIFPKSLLVWSDILSRPFRKGQGHKPVYRTDLASTGREINRRIHLIVKELGGSAISHGNIKPEHFDCEGGQLSDKGEQLFHQNIVRFVDQWKWDGNSTPGPAEGHRERLTPPTDQTGQSITGTSAFPTLNI